MANSNDKDEIMSSTIDLETPGQDTSTNQLNTPEPGAASTPGARSPGSRSPGATTPGATTPRTPGAPGAPGATTTGGAGGGDSAFEDEDDGFFEDEEDSDAWGPVHEQDESDLIASRSQKQNERSHLMQSQASIDNNNNSHNNEPMGPSADGSNPAPEGFEKPEIDEENLKRKEKCWVCPTCLAANNLKETMDRGFKCINGCDSYNAKTLHVIYVNDWEHEPRQDEIERFNNLAMGHIFACWKCPKCDWINDVTWRRCVFPTCGHVRLELTSPTEYHSLKPYDPSKLGMEEDNKPAARQNNYNNNNNNNNYQQYNRDLDYNAALKMSEIFNQDYGKQWAARRKEEERQRRLRKLNNVLDTRLKGGDFPGSRMHEQGEERLVRAFGLPYCNAYLRRLEARPYLATNTIMHGHMMLSGPKGAQNAYGHVFNLKEMSLLSSRNVALNQSNGWYAMLLYDVVSDLPYLCVFEALGSFGVRLVCYECLQGLYVEAAAGSKVVRQIADKQDLKGKIRMTRVRFVKGNNVFVYVWHSPTSQIYQYKVQFNANMQPQQGRARLELFNQFRDDYIYKADVSDIDVLSDPSMVAVIFTKWMGFYKLDMDSKDAKLEWFHAVAVSKSPIELENFTIVSEDHATLPWAVESKLMEYREALRKQKDRDENDSKMDSAEVTAGGDAVVTNAEDAEDPEELLKNLAVDAAFRQLFKDEEEENKDNKVTVRTFDKYDVLKHPNEIDFSRVTLQSELNRSKQTIDRLSHRYYTYVNGEKGLFAVHPCNQNYNYMMGTDYMDPNKALYCVSKQYGVFYTNDDKSAVRLSDLNSDTQDPVIFSFGSENGNPSIQNQCVIESYGVGKDEMQSNGENDEKREDKNGVFMTLLNDPKYIPLKLDMCCRICDISYDESYGVSGRLLLTFKMYDNDPMRNNLVPLGEGGGYGMQQILNFSELVPLEEELGRLYEKSKGVAYCNGMVPGTNVKPFNLVVEVYTFLFGKEMIDELIESKNFNFGLKKEIEIVERIGKNVDNNDASDVNVVNGANGANGANEQSGPGFE